MLNLDEQYKPALIKSIKDGLENFVAALGTERDKRNASTFQNNKRLSLLQRRGELNALYRTEWLSGKVVDIIPNDMTREWRSFTGDIEPEVVDKLIEEEERLILPNKFNQTHKWSRLYGTSLLVMSIDDGQTPEHPLDINRIKPGGLRFIHAVDRNRFENTNVEPIVNPLDRNYGMPEFYLFNESSVRIHHSRVLRFDAVILPFDEFRTNNYMSDSVLDRLYESITNFHTAADSSASMIYETNVDVVKVKGLMNLLQTSDGEQMLRKRFTLASMLKSFNNMLLLDNEEEFKDKKNSFAGLPDLIDRFSQVLASASDIPATRLLGSSASGLNATGEGDLKNYYDMLRSRQVSEYKPKLDYFDKIMAKSMGLGDDLDLSYEFNPLFQMTPKQQAEIDTSNATRDQIYLVNGVIDEVIIAKELKQNGTYTNITDEYIKELEDNLEEEDDLGNGFNPDPDDLEPGDKQEAKEGAEEES